MATGYPMSRTASAAYDPLFLIYQQDDSRLPTSDTNTQDHPILGNFGLVKQQFDEGFTALPNNLSQQPTGSPIDTTSQGLQPTFDFSCSSNSLATPTDPAYWGYRQTQSGELDSIGSWNAHLFIDSLSHGHGQPNPTSVGSDLCYENIPQGNLDWLNETNFPSAISDLDTQSGGLAFTASTYVDSNNMDYNPVEPQINLVERGVLFNVSAQAAGYPNLPVESYLEGSITSWNGLSTASPHTNPQTSSSPLSHRSSSPTRYACHHPQCSGLSFSRRADRDRHARVHDGDRPFVCPRANCRKAFYRNDKLQSHLLNGHHST